MVMMGTGPFAVPTFRALLESPHDVAALVTRPLARAPTRGKPPVNPMQDEAVARGVEVLAPDDLNNASAHEVLRARGADLFVVCDYGQILSSETLALTELGGINLHGSLLPRYRGAAPVNWAVAEGETVTGVTVIHMTPRLDAGPVLTVRETPIGPDETADVLEARLAELGVQAVHEAIRRLIDWDRVSPLGTPQDAAKATRAPRLKKRDGQIDWSLDARKICNRIRGFQPWPGSFTCLDRGKKGTLRLILERARPVPDCRVTARPGSVVRSDDAHLWVAAGEGAVAIEQIRPAGKRSMSIDEFVRGYPLAAGTRLGDP